MIVLSLKQLILRFNVKGTLMKFKDKKEYYSLRKFKGVGLASAVVGLAFLSPSVLAEENTINSQSNEISVIKPVDTMSNSTTNEMFSEVSATSIKQKEDVSPVVNDVNKPSETKSQDNIVVTPVVEPDHKDDKASISTEVASKSLENKEDILTELSNSVSSNESTRSRRGKRDTSSQESPYVSYKAKEVVRELNDTLVMKKEDTASTSDTLFKLDDGVKPTEEEKAYVNTIKDAFNDLPELLRSSVNSLTIVRKPNGLYGYTYSKEGNVNMNMQYYHPELTYHF